MKTFIFVPAAFFVGAIAVVDRPGGRLVFRQSWRRQHEP